MLWHLQRLARRFIDEDAGQDLIEYGLLTAIVTVGSLLVIAAIRTKMATAYDGWGNAIEANWEPPPPSVP